MDSSKIYPVVLAGGVGERFWPCSRASRPKQLIPLLGPQTLLEDTLSRAFKIGKPENTIIVTRESLVKEILKKPLSKKCKIIGEPVGKNTAPAIAAAASWILSKDKDGVMVVLSSDHKISPISNFVKSVKKAVAIAQEDYLAVFGIKPQRADTGYGYIKKGEKLKEVFEVNKFCEKPDIKTAKAFFKNGSYLWNSGMFVWKASSIINEFQMQMPKVYNLAKTLEKSWGKRKEKSTLNEFYTKSPSQSIDYGIMEGAKKVAVVEATFSWDDVGAWDALWRIKKTDKNGNVNHGTTLGIDNKNSLIFADGGFVVGAGLENMVVVHSKEMVLVIPRSYLGNIKKITALIKKKKDLRDYLK